MAVGCKRTEIDSTVGEKIVKFRNGGKNEWDYDTVGWNRHGVLFSYFVYRKYRVSKDGGQEDTRGIDGGIWGSQGIVGFLRN